jgi:hypothetical protein
LDFKNIFAQKFGEKFGFCVQNTGSFLPKFVSKWWFLRKSANIFAEIAIIISTPSSSPPPPFNLFFSRPPPTDGQHVLARGHCPLNNRL